MGPQRDIPGRIARWLFRIGFIWAAILLPVTIIAFLSAFDKGFRFWQLGAYFIVGFGVWVG